MAQQHNFPNVTLALTLPISCHICLGKVRQPVICVNHHVFCSACIEMWLKTASRCPACRVPITEDNPCREIIGGTNESEPSESYNVKRRLRKTRGELLLKEYEDDIEALLKENEDLKATNERLESQLKIALDPCTVSANSQSEENNMDLGVLEEWTNKLRAATDRYCEVNREVERLKEANKMLRSQNIDLVQESMRLKAEVASRSPQKFGRYTVAALEAKIQQYERDVAHLRRALERSDQYIEDLESRGYRGTGSDNKDNEGPSDDPGDEPAPPPESGEVGPSVGAGKRRIAALRRSLSDMETASIRTDLEGEGSRTIPRGGGLLATSLGLAAPDPSSATGPFLPSTPSSAFRSLSLKSPRLRDDAKPGAKPGAKPPAYLRRLSFQDCGVVVGGASPAGSPLAGEEPSRPAPLFWGAWQSSESAHLTGTGPVEEDRRPARGEGKPAAPAGPAPGPPEEDPADDDGGMSSEASMDAAYLDKVSELNSMMLEGEGGRGSRLSLRSTPGPSGEERTDAAGGGVKAASTPAGSPVRRGSGGPTPPPAPGGGAGDPPQTDEPSSDLPFDPPPENKEGPSGSHTSAGHASSSSGIPGNTVRDTAKVTPSLPAKRKSHSPFNIASPSKHSKYT